jgi:class 3 adenylate cyclase
METHHDSRRPSIHWVIHSVAVALTVIQLSLFGLLEGIDGGAYKTIVDQVGSEALQKQFPGAAAKNAFDARNIVEPTQAYSTFQQVSSAVTAVLVTVAAFTVAWITTRFHLALSLGLAASLSAGYLLVAVLMGSATHGALELRAGIFALTLGYGVMAVKAVFVACKQRYVRRQICSLHVPTDLAESIWKHRKQFLPGGGLYSQQLPVTVLFAEMKGFAHRSGELEPKVVTKRMAEYLDTMARVVVDHHGMVEQCFGDALKAIFGAPFPRASSEEIHADASQAVACAVAMGEALQVVNRRWQDRGLPPIDMRVGLSTGVVAVLCDGRTVPLKFTTMGEAVRCAGHLVRHPHGVDDPTLSPCSCRILTGTSTAAYLGERFWFHQIETGTGPFSDLARGVYRVYGKYDRPVLNQEGDLRSSSRVDIMTPVTLANGMGVNGLTSNIGVGGMAVCRLIQPLQIGRTMLLRFEVPGRAHAIQATGTVVWTMQDRAGIAFVALTPSDRVMLNSFVIQEVAKRSLVLP